jgi:GST-like protein
VRLDQEEQLRPEFLALNPNHKIPVLVDSGQTIWESGAILLHLGEQHDPAGTILPKDLGQRMQAIQYAFFQTGGVGPNLGRLGAALRKQGEKNQEMIDLFGAEMDRLVGVIDRILEDGRAYMVGDYSIGDIMHFPWLRLAQQLGVPWISERPRVVDWLDRIAERPAVVRGLSVPE